MAVPTTPPPPPLSATRHPLKRKQSQSPQSHPPLKRKRTQSPQPPPLPTPFLLLALPFLLVLPPTHPHHIPSLRLSLLAIRRCLQLRSKLSPVIECRAWVAFAELGMKTVSAGLSGGDGGVVWAHGLDNEIGVAIGKGLVLSQAHPNLRQHTHQLTLLHARLSNWQRNHKFARALLRRHVAAFSTTDLPAHQYAAHLALVAHALAANPIDLPAALNTLAAIQGLAERWGHPDVALLGQVIKLRALVSALDWVQVFPLLETLESILHLVFPGSNSESTSQVREIASVSSLHTSLELHVLALGVLAHVHAGRSQDAKARIALLHTTLDAGALDKKGIREGVIEVSLGTSPPLLVHTTHPRVFFHLAFLVSAVAMRDATGRRPKPKVFATEGLAVCERERPKDPQRGVGRYPRWAELHERQYVEERLVRIEADLLSELVGVCIQRSEFEEAEENLARLIAHTRKHALWDAYSARVTLQHAYLAHGLCDRVRALQCYRVAAYLAAKQERGRGIVQADIAVARFIRVAAQAGEVSLRLGIARTKMGPGDVLDPHLLKWGSEVAGECRILGGTLEAVGRVLQACLTEEIIVAKNHLKASLRVTTEALDNHLRALVLALTSSHYLHTSPDYAEVMLKTARQLAAGLGAPASKAHDSMTSMTHESEQPRKVGNAPLGLWVGQRFLELYRRTGRDARARQQQTINEELCRSLDRTQKRVRLSECGCEGDGPGDATDVHME